MPEATLIEIPMGDDPWWDLDNALGLVRVQKRDKTPKGDAEPDVQQRRGRPEGDDLQRSGLLVVSPPIPLDALARLPQENGTLLQCMMAMAVNVHGYGWDLEYVGPPEEEAEPEAPKPELKVKAPAVAEDDEAAQVAAKAAKPPPKPGAAEQPEPQGPTPDQIIAAAAASPPSAPKKEPKPVPKGPPKTGPESKAALDEAIRVRTFFLTCNARESFDGLRYKLCMDLEGTGNAWWELAREGNGTGEVAGIDHLPAYTMRLTPLDGYTTPVEATMLGVDGEVIKRRVRLRFRRYVQIQQGRYVYFKELGDPRDISAFDGRPLDETLGMGGERDRARAEGVTPEPQRAVKFEQLPTRGEITSGLSAAALTPLLQPTDLATEVLHFTNVYLSDSPYGGTKYMGNIPSIRGARYTELVNLQLFRKNAIPAMIVLIGGGGLTPESKAQIREYFSNEFQGLANVQRVLVLEAISQTSSVEAQRSAVTIDVKPLQQYGSQGDGYFLNYGQRCRENITASFRLPAIYLGYGGEASNYATAQAMRITAEEQVFQPERNAFDEVINMRLLRPMGVRFWRFFSKGPAIADVASYTAAMQAFSAMGALTPNIAIELMNELLDTEVDPISQEWGDYPFPIVLGLLGQGKLVGVEEIEKEGPSPLDMLLGGGGGPPFGGKPGAKPFGGKPGVPGGTPTVPEEGATKDPKKPMPGDAPAGKEAATGVAQKGDEGDELVAGWPLLVVAKGVRDLQRGLAMVQQQLATMGVRKADMSTGDLAGGGMLVPQQGGRMRRAYQRPRRPGWR